MTTSHLNVSLCSAVIWLFLCLAEKLPPYEISRPEVFASCKRLVDIGKKIEQLESKMKAVQSNASWVEKCAKEMDILLDDDEMYVNKLH